MTRPSPPPSSGPRRPEARGVRQRVLVGTTASGKKAVATELAQRHGLTLLSMDSMKVYRGMDVGTDKPSPEQRARAPWRLLDLVGHDEAFSAGRWVEAAVEVAAAATGPLLFAGGTPLYLRLLVEGLAEGPGSSPELRQELEAAWEAEGEAVIRAELARVDPVIEARLQRGDKKRLLRALEVHRLTGRALSDWQRDTTRPPLPGDFTLVGLRWPEAAHRQRSEQRVEAMLADGLVEEVRALRARAPFAPEPGKAIGYAEAQAFLDGSLDEQGLRERTAIRTRQLVRKQRTFFAAFADLHWVDVDPAESLESLTDRTERALGLGDVG